MAAGMRSGLIRATALLSGVMAGSILSAPALAHPHVFIEAKANLVFDAAGKLSAIRHVWRFDDAYSAFASQGLDADGDGELSVTELKPLADVNVESLAEFEYFTFLSAGDRELGFSKPTEYWLQSDGGLLTLYMTLPVEAPIEVRSLPARVDVYDPTLYVAFAFVEENAIETENAPAGCKFEVQRPTELDPTTAATLAGIGPEQRDLPPELLDITRDLTNGVSLSCP